jgi:hypothetical protein
MARRHVVTIDDIGLRGGAILGLEVRDKLVAEKVIIDPRVRPPPVRTA